MSKTHGMTKTKEYHSWYHAKYRCRNPKNHRYPWYGARGIRFCERWNDFAVFYGDMGAAPSPRHELDRIDNDGDYEPGNCRWATRAQQVRNTRKTVLSEELVADLRRHIKAGGQVRAWARAHGIHEQACYNVTGRGAWKPLGLTT